jgi:hypothetical protein
MMTSTGPRHHGTRCSETREQGWCTEYSAAASVRRSSRSDSSIALIGLLDVDTLYMLTNEGITLGTMALEALTTANAFVLWRSSQIV